MAVFRQVAMLFWLGAFGLAVYLLYVGATGFGFVSLVVVPAWLLPVLLFTLGLLAYAIGSRNEGREA